MSNFQLRLCALLVAVAGAGCAEPATTPPHAMTVAPMHAGVDASAKKASYRVVYSFSGGSQDGRFPVAGLIALKGTLYGTTSSGGPASGGTVFSASKSGNEHVLHIFGGTSSRGDGSTPRSKLVNINGTLYGTTCDGGAAGHGTVFSITPSGTEKVLYSFKGEPDGDRPCFGESMIAVSGTLYGVTQSGGTSNDGTVFSVTTSGTEKVLYSFTGAPDGQAPNTLLDVNGTLYATTYYGGTGSCTYRDISGCGTVISVSTSGSEKVLYSFAGGSDGQWPSGGLIDVKGTLFGTTSFGGSGNCSYSSDSSGCGTVFSVTTSGSEHVLYSFTGPPDGEVPYTALVNVKNTLYGTTEEGGTYFSGRFSYGTLFSITTAGKEQVLHDFGDSAESDGIYPFDLVDVKGTLYGVTEDGGTHQDGTVFAFRP